MEIWGLSNMLELKVIVAVVCGLGLAVAIVVETFRRRLNHNHLEADPIFEDPNSLKQVKCPYIYDPAEKYISLIIPAYNEQLRLPAALDETMKLKQIGKEETRVSLTNESI